MLHIMRYTTTAFKGTLSRSAGVIRNALKHASTQETCKL